MSVSYDVSTDLGKTRLLTFDTDTTNPIYQDEEHQAFLDLNAGNVRLAAAQAIDAIAGNEAYVQKMIKMLDLMTNGPQTAMALRAAADELRRQVYEGSGDFSGMFDIAEQVYDNWTLNEHFVKSWMRTNQ
jgi:hypothetical protein